MITPDSPNAARGTHLCADDRAYVLSSYVNRYTGQHRPAWARKEWKDGKPYPLQFVNDLEWLANTWFAVRKNGRLDRRHNQCYSRSTWPNNPELRKPNGQ